MKSEDGREIRMNTEGQGVNTEIFVGATGHRILAEPDRIRAGVTIALNRILELFPGGTITILSSLAEGSDRLIVQQVLTQPGARLIVPLPMPKSKYMEDFATSESKEEFLELLSQAAKVIELTPMSVRNQSYEEAGKYILDHSQALLAVWDGQLEQGKGGTGAIVAQGRARGLPLAWIHAGNRKPGTSEPTTLGAEQGTVTFERLGAVVR